MDQELHKHPYKGTNNRKLTLGRIREISKYQSIPVWEKDEDGNCLKFLGYKYVYHKPKEYKRPTK